MFGICRLNHKKYVIAFLLLSITFNFFSYGEKSVEKLVDGIIWLSPPSLKGFLGVYKKSVIEGVKDTLMRDKSLSSEEIASRLEKEMDEIKKIPSSQPSFETIAYKFGKSAGFVFLLDDPFREESSEEVEKIKEDYYRYIESRIDRLVLTFDGYDNPPFEKPIAKYFDKRRGDFKRYIDSVLFCYFPDGKMVSSKTFDDRSNAFGVAQIILSRSVSDAAKVWLEMWKNMDGDLKDTPFLEKRVRK